MQRGKIIGLLSGAVVVGLATAYYFINREPKHEMTVVPTVEVEEIVIPEPVLKYGLPVDSFEMTIDKVKKNQYLSKILQGFDVPYSSIDKIAKESKEVFDIRRIRPNHKYTAFLSPDSIHSLKYFVYEIDKTDYVVYEFGDSLNYWRAQKEITTKRRVGAGEITSSVWNAFNDNDMNPILANKLSDIFAWTIDFFAIQKGDKFKIIYDEKYVEGQAIGIGDIYAVEFEHMGQNYDAYRYAQDSISHSHFFDSDGKSLRKAFLKAPLQFSRISSKFSYSRMHPVFHYRRPHLGVDYAAPTGTPVVSIGDGTVIKKSYQKNGGGYYLKIKHNSVYVTTYMHFSKYAKGIHVGQRVKQGDVIGYVGATGAATGPHLDFRVHMNGKAIDPLKMKAPPIEPIKKENIAGFQVVVDSLSTQLKEIAFIETNEAEAQLLN